MDIIKKIGSISLYNLGIALLNYITLLAAVTGSFFTLQSTGIIPNNPEYVAKIFQVISISSASWFAALAIIAIISDTITNTDHLDRLLHDASYYKYKVTIDVNYSRFIAMMTRIIPELTSVIFLTGIIGYYGFDLSKEEVGHLLTILSTAILSGGTLATIIVIPAKLIHRKTDAHKTSEQQKLMGMLKQFVMNQPYQTTQEIIESLLVQPRIENYPTAVQSHPQAFPMHPYPLQTADTIPILTGGPAWSAPQVAPAMATLHLFTAHRSAP